MDIKRDERIFNILLFFMCISIIPLIILLFYYDCIPNTNICNTIHILLYISIAIFFIFLLSLVLFTLYIVYYKKYNT